MRSEEIRELIGKVEAGEKIKIRYGCFIRELTEEDIDDLQCAAAMSKMFEGLEQCLVTNAATVSLDGVVDTCRELRVREWYRGEA